MPRRNNQHAAYKPNSILTQLPDGGPLGKGTVNDFPIACCMGGPYPVGLHFVPQRATWWLERLGSV
eukprot:1924661-Lingulodinium_polyedra.AAC.1